MAFDRLFCPIKSRASSKQRLVGHKNEPRTAPTAANSNSTTSTNEILANENRNNSHNLRNHLIDNEILNNATNINATNAINQAINHLTKLPPLKFVTSEYHAANDDELSVCPGYRVLVDYEDTDANGKEWSHVFCFQTKNQGFVPKEILSIEPQQCKKKLPRSAANHQLDQTNHLHHHRAHYASDKNCHSNGGSIRGLHQANHLRDYHHRFDMQPPNSLQGSSGCQTFQKFYPDFKNFSPPAYHNVRPTVPQYDVRYELDYSPFHVTGHELYVVMHNFVYREESDLSVKPGECVYVLNKEDEDWYWVKRVYDSEEGFVPGAFLCPYAQVESILNKGNSTITMKSSNHNDFHTYINHRPERESLPTDQQSLSFQQL